MVGMSETAAETRKVVHEALRAERTARDYFVKAPLVIDCTHDSEDFAASITHERRQVITERYAKGELRYVSGLWGKAKDYAMRKLRQRYAELDRETVSRLERLLTDWHAERGRSPEQLSKPQGSFDGGVDIVLPLHRIRLSYDLACLSVL
jgi:hypothetical protein